MATLDPSEIMFTPFEPKLKNRFIMYIEGVPAYLIKTANRPQIQFEEIVLDHINVKRIKNLRVGGIVGRWFRI